MIEDIPQMSPMEFKTFYDKKLKDIVILDVRNFTEWK